MFLMLAVSLPIWCWMLSWPRFLALRWIRPAVPEPKVLGFASPAPATESTGIEDLRGHPSGGPDARPGPPMPPPDNLLGFVPTGPSGRDDR